MRKLAIIALSMMSMNTQAQVKINHFITSKDSVDGGLIFKGELDFPILNTEPTFDWFKKGVAEYKPNTADIKKLDPALKQYSLVVVMGTWCDDSHNLVPKLYKVLSDANYPLSQVTMFGVDRAKAIGEGREKTYNITYVPAIIVFDGTKEIGRITESVQTSIEADLFAIIDKYKKN